MLVYLDACTLIYLVEGDVALVESVVRIIDRDDVRLVTSQLTRLECRVQPLRVGDVDLLGQYERVFAAADLSLIEVTEAILEGATEIRAKLGLKTPDAIHAATAIEVGADLFVTGDDAFTRVRELRVELVAIS